MCYDTEVCYVNAIPSTQRPELHIAIPYTNHDCFWAVLVFRGCRLCGVKYPAGEQEVDHRRQGVDGRGHKDREDRR